MHQIRKFTYLWLFGVLALLTACELQPIYDAQVETELTQIEFAPMANREGQILRSALQRAFDPKGVNPPPLYKFSGTSTVTVNLILPEETEFRSAQGTMTLKGMLRNQAGEVLWSGHLSSSALFAQHVLPSISADAQERLWQALSSQLAQDLIIALSPVL